MKELTYTYANDMQTLCERTMGYIVMANKFINKKIENLTPRIFLLPTGNEIHSKILQAIAYKVIQKAYYKEKNMTFVIVTKKNTLCTNNGKEIDNNCIQLFFPKAQKTMPIFWYKIPCKKLIDYFDNTYFQKKNHKRKLISDDNIYHNQNDFFSQLPFLRLLIPKCNILPIQIDATAISEEIAKLFFDLYTKDWKIVFLFLSNIDIAKEKLPENVILEEVFLWLETNKNTMQNLVEDNKILQIFFTFGQMLKKPIQTIMYTDSKESKKQQKDIYEIYSVLGI